MTSDDKSQARSDPRRALAGRIEAIQALLDEIRAKGISEAQLSKIASFDPAGVISARRLADFAQAQIGFNIAVIDAMVGIVGGEDGQISLIRKAFDANRLAMNASHEMVDEFVSSLERQIAGLEAALNGELEQ